MHHNLLCIRCEREFNCRIKTARVQVSSGLARASADTYPDKAIYWIS